MTASDENANNDSLDAGSASDDTGSRMSETPEARTARINRIREAIDRGEYESEDLLEKAMRRMMERIERPDSNDHGSNDSDSPGNVRS